MVFDYNRVNLFMTYRTYGAAVVALRDEPAHLTFGVVSKHLTSGYKHAKSGWASCTRSVKAQYGIHNSEYISHLR